MTGKKKKKLHQPPKSPSYSKPSLTFPVYTVAIVITTCCFVFLHSTLSLSGMLKFLCCCFIVPLSPLKDASEKAEVFVFLHCCIANIQSNISQHWHYSHLGQTILCCRVWSCALQDISSIFVFYPQASGNPHSHYLLMTTKND